MRQAVGTAIPDMDCNLSVTGSVSSTENRNKWDNNRHSERKPSIESKLIENINVILVQNHLFGKAIKPRFQSMKSRMCRALQTARFRRECPLNEPPKDHDEYEVLLEMTCSAPTR